MAQKVEYELSLKDLLSGKLREADSAAKILENTVRNIGTAVGAAFAVSKIKDFAMSIVDVGSKMETLDNVIKYTSINTEDAAKNHEFLNHIINDYKLPILETTEGFSNLSAAMLGSSLQGQGARDVFEGVSIASTAMHLSAEKTNAVFYALNNMMSNGTVQAQDLKLQLGNALPGAFNLAAKSMGMTQVAFKKLMEEGGIVSSEFLPKFASYLKQEFSGAIPTAVQSTTANMNELSNKFLLLKNQMFEDLKPAITSIIEGLANLIKWLRDAWDWLVKHKDIIKSLAIGIGVVKAALILYRTWVILTTSSTTLGTIAQIALGRAYDVSTKSTGLLTAAQVGLNAALKANPRGLVITAVMGLVTAFDYLYEKYEKFRNFSDAVVDYVRGNTGSMLANVSMMFMDKEEPQVSFAERRAAEVVIPGMRSMFDEPTKDLDTFSMKLGNVKKKASSIINTGKNEDRKKDVSAKGAVGNKSVTINIKMDNLVKEFKVITTNIKESPEKILELLKPAFASVINDSQIIGNR